MDYAFDYVASNHPLQSITSYPYTASVGTCVYQGAQASTSVGSISSHSDVPPSDVNAMKNALLK